MCCRRYDGFLAVDLLFISFFSLSSQKNTSLSFFCLLFQFQFLFFLFLIFFILLYKFYCFQFSHSIPIWHILFFSPAVLIVLISYFLLGLFVNFFFNLVLNSNLSYMIIFNFFHLLLISSFFWFSISSFNPSLLYFFLIWSSYF